MKRATVLTAVIIVLIVSMMGVATARDNGRQEVDIRVPDHPGEGQTQIVVDGREMERDPGEYTMRLSPGNHTVTIKKAGEVLETKTVTIPPVGTPATNPFDGSAVDGPPVDGSAVGDPSADDLSPDNSPYGSSVGNSSVDNSSESSGDTWYSNRRSDRGVNESEGYNTTAQSRDEGFRANGSRWNSSSRQSDPPRRSDDVTSGDELIDPGRQRIGRTSDPESGGEVTENYTLSATKFTSGHDESTVYPTRFKDGVRNEPEKFERSAMPPQNPVGDLEDFTNMREKSVKPAVVGHVNESINVGVGFYSIPQARYRLNLTYGMQSHPTGDANLYLMKSDGETLGDPIPLERTGSVARTVRQPDDVSERKLTYRLTDTQSQYVNQTGALYALFSSDSQTNIYIHDMKLKVGDSDTSVNEKQSVADEKVDLVDGGVENASINGTYTSTTDRDNRYGTVDVKKCEETYFDTRVVNQGGSTTRETVELVDLYDGMRDVIQREMVTVPPHTTKRVALTPKFCDETGLHEVVIESSGTDATSLNDGETVDVYVEKPPTPKVLDVEVPDSNLQYDDFAAAVTVRNMGDVTGRATIDARFDDWRGSKTVVLRGGDVRQNVEGPKKVVKFDEDDVEYHPERVGSPRGPYSTQVGVHDFVAETESSTAREPVSIYALNITELQINTSNFRDEGVWLASGSPYVASDQDVPDAGFNASKYDVSDLDTGSVPRFGWNHPHPLVDYNESTGNYSGEYSNQTLTARVKVSNNGTDEGVARVKLQTDRQTDGSGVYRNVVGAGAETVPPNQSRWIEVPLVIPNREDVSGKHVVSATTLYSRDHIRYRDLGGELTRANQVNTTVETWGDLRKDIEYNTEVNEWCSGRNPGSGECPVGNATEEEFWLNLTHRNAGGKPINFNHTPQLRWNRSPGTHKPARSFNNSLLDITNSTSYVSYHGAGNRTQKFAANLTPNQKTRYNDSGYRFDEPGYYTLDLESFAENRRNITPYTNRSANLSIKVNDVTDPVALQNDTPRHNDMKSEAEKIDTKLACLREHGTMTAKIDDSPTRPPKGFTGVRCQNLYTNISNSSTVDSYTDYLTEELWSGDTKRYTYSPHSANEERNVTAKIRKSYPTKRKCRSGCSASYNSTTFTVETSDVDGLNAALLRAEQEVNRSQLNNKATGYLELKKDGEVGRLVNELNSVGRSEDMNLGNYSKSTEGIWEVNTTYTPLQESLATSKLVHTTQRFFGPLEMYRRTNGTMVVRTPSKCSDRYDSRKYGCGETRYEVEQVNVNVSKRNLEVWEGGSIKFNASGSSDNVGIERYSWRFVNTDTGESFGRTGKAVSERFKTPGSWKAVLSVNDNPTLGVDGANRNVSVKRFEVVADTNPIRVDEREKITKNNGTTRNGIEEWSKVWADHDNMWASDTILATFRIDEPEIGPRKDWIDETSEYFGSRFHRGEPQLHPHEASSTVAGTDIDRIKEKTTDRRNNQGGALKKKSLYHQFNLDGFTVFNPLTRWWRQTVEFPVKYTAVGSGDNGKNRRNVSVSPGQLATYNVVDFAGQGDSERVNPGAGVDVVVDNVKPNWSAARYDSDWNTSRYEFDSTFGDAFTMEFEETCASPYDTGKSVPLYKIDGYVEDEGPYGGIGIHTPITPENGWSVVDGSRTQIYTFEIEDLHGNSRKFRLPVKTVGDSRIPPEGCQI